MTPHTQTVEPVRFFSGGIDGSPPDPTSEATYGLVRDTSTGKERFQLVGRIGYRRRGSQGDTLIVVPKNLKQWRTDFASIPWAFAWLVPRSGNHLPAAILHDGLLDGDFGYVRDGALVFFDAAAPDDPRAPNISRDEADDILKEAMGDLGTGVVRRWLIWTAVTIATICKLRTRHERSWRGKWYCGVAVFSSLLFIGLGVIATANVAATAGMHVAAGVPILWWMPSSNLLIQLLQGLAGAAVIPAALSVFWGRFWRAGLIAGIAFAALLHVTVAVALLTLVYLGLERVGRISQGRLLLWLLVVAGVACLVGFGVSLAR